MPAVRVEGVKFITPAWPVILSSPKSLVETGEPLEFRLGA